MYCLLNSIEDYHNCVVFFPDGEKMVETFTESNKCIAEALTGKREYPLSNIYMIKESELDQSTCSKIFQIDSEKEKIKGAEHVEKVMNYFGDVMGVIQNKVLNDSNNKIEENTIYICSKDFLDKYNL